MSGFRFPIYQFKFHLPKAAGAAIRPPSSAGAGPTGGGGRGGGGGVSILLRTQKPEKVSSEGEVCDRQSDGWV